MAMLEQLRRDFRTGSKKYLKTIFRLNGSVLPYGALFALPGAIATGILHATWNPDLKGTDNIEVARFGDVWTAYTFSLGFLVVFRNNQAYNRFWEGASKVHEIRAELFSCASTLMAYCSSKEEMQEEVANFQELLIRLVSLLFATCMSEISTDDDEIDPEEMMQVIDLTGIDRQSLDHMQHSPSRCEVIIQWITRLMIESLHNHIIDVPPPILNRSTTDLASAIVDIYRVRKIKEVPFPFPYSQMVLLMLAVYSLVTPILASQLIDSLSMAVVASFCVQTAFWSLYQIADEIDQPFGTDPNDLPMHDMQMDFNKSLLHLIQPATQRVPSFVRPSSAMRLTKVGKVDHLSASHKVLAMAGPQPSEAKLEATSSISSISAPLAPRRKTGTRRKMGLKKKRRVLTDSEPGQVEVPFEVRIIDTSAETTYDEQKQPNRGRTPPYFSTVSR